MKTPTVMTIGGSDPSGGAGIQADLKAFNLLHLHGTTTITSITVQNTKRVSLVQPLSTHLIEQQIDELMTDFSIQTVKTGLLYNNEITNLIAKKAQEYHWKLIIDPVMGATTGDKLSAQKENISALSDLCAHSYMITPNLIEAKILTNTAITTIEEMKKAAIKLKEYGPSYILIKGGHLHSTQAIDILYDGKQFYEFTLPYIQNKKAHGSGCTLSALITGYLALQKTPVVAVRDAKHILWEMINEGFYPGKGVDLLNTSPSVIPRSPPPMPTIKHFNIWNELQQQLSKLYQILPTSFIPEVGINIGYALPKATKKEDICALTGRIIKTSKNKRYCGHLEFGGSIHIASIILAAMQFQPNLRAAMNIAYSKKHLEKSEKADLIISCFDRENQPKEIDSTMEWGTKQAMINNEKTPDLIYDTGSVGKEPMIRIIGTNPKNIYEKIDRILKQH